MRASYPVFLYTKAKIFGGFTRGDGIMAAMIFLTLNFLKFTGIKGLLLTGLIMMVVKFSMARLHRSFFRLILISGGSFNWKFPKKMRSSDDR